MCTSTLTSFAKAKILSNPSVSRQNCTRSCFHETLISFSHPCNASLIELFLLNWLEMFFMMTAFLLELTSSSSEARKRMG